MSQYRFPCGCTWPILEHRGQDECPLLDFDIEKAPRDCSATWALLAEGHCKGVFQLETSLGKTWTKKLKPTSIEHMGALGAILRPGCLKAVDDEGVSMTQHFCRRKNGEEPIDAIHPLLDAITSRTFGIIVYQETMMHIARELAGFDPIQVDRLRKGIGKKSMKIIAELRQEFLEGARTKGVLTEQQAAAVWGQIEKSGRYAFNASHAISYGITGYETAYLKAHFPLAFFTSWLLHADKKPDRQEEVYELVNDMRFFGLDVLPPDVRSQEHHVHVHEGQVRLGLADIKGVGASFLARLANHPVGPGTTWFSFLVEKSPHLSSNVVRRLIESGACRCFGLPRRRMLAEYRAWYELTDKEQAWVAQGGFSDLLEALEALARPHKKKDIVRSVRLPKPGKEGEVLALEEEHQRLLAAEPSALRDRQLAANRRAFRQLTQSSKEVVPGPPPPWGGCSSDARERVVASLVASIRHPPSPLVDTPLWVSAMEEELLGISLTYHKIDSCSAADVDTTCREIRGGRKGMAVLGVEVRSVREVKTRGGANPGSPMGFLTVSDSTCALDDIVCFPDVWKEHAHLFQVGNTVYLQGELDKKKGSTSFIVHGAWQAT
jgi:DNA polymerase III alpha subunit